jgi:hypothetical protein
MRTVAQEFPMSFWSWSIFLPSWLPTDADYSSHATVEIKARELDPIAAAAAAGLHHES